jgi:hypothetical protein
MFFYSHVAPVSGAVPTPGKDMPDAPWRRHMGFGEIALFIFDAKSGQLLGPKHNVPQLPVQEVCMVFGSRYTARLNARGHVKSNPQVMICFMTGEDAGCRPDLGKEKHGAIRG